MTPLRIASLVAGLFLSIPFAPMAAAQPRRWIEDLDFLSETMTAKHPNLFAHIPREAFQRSVQELRDQIPSLSTEQILTRMMTIAALPRDGHTTLFPFGPESRFFPLHLYVFSDGVFVVNARKPYEDLIGKQLTRIGRRKIEDAMHAVLPAIPADNSMWALSNLPLLLISGTVLQGSGLIDDPFQATFTLRNGDLEQEVPIQSVAILEALDFAGDPNVLLRLPVRPQPLYVSDPSAFWFRFLDASRTLYIQYNNVLAESLSGERLSQFVARVRAFLDNSAVDRVVVDLRHNNGGNRNTYAPLASLLETHRQTADAGKLYVITGRRTFSAAQNFATELSLRSSAIFAGEPTGGAPNHYGDPLTIPLPNSGYPMEVSTVYHEDAPGDTRPWIAPGFPVALSSSDYFRQIDPVLEAILGSKTPPPTEWTFAAGEGGAIARIRGGADPRDGYASVAGESDRIPAGFAAISFRRNGALIGESSVPASELTMSGRIYVDMTAPVRTGISLVAPGIRPAVVRFWFTDGSGARVGEGSVTVPANGQITRFLDEFPFVAERGLRGALTFVADAPVGVAALRSVMNERGEELLTTMPAAPLESTTPPGAILPYFVDGGGWTSEVLLVNPTDRLLTGELVFQTARDGAARSAYAVAPGSSQSIRTSGAQVRSGFLRIVPEGGSKPPAGAVVLAFQQNLVTVSEAVITPRAVSERAWMFAEIRDGAETQVAIANPSASAVTVRLELTSSAGEKKSSASLEIPPEGSVSLLLRQIPGFEAAVEMEGTLLMTASAPGAAAVALRMRLNERGELLTMGTPTSVDEEAPNARLALPYFRDGGGASSQFVLLRGSGKVYFFGPLGQPLPLGLN